MKLLAASANPHKLEEIRRILSHLGVTVISPPEIGLDIDVEETGQTFSENAYIKALAYHKASGLPAVADDSGLCVDALNGRPGVLSARYQEDAPYHKKITALLEELKDIPQDKRTARFISAVCCVINEKNIITCEAVCEGYIGLNAAGGGGFGYDPIFYIGGRSMAERSDKEKDELSHRGKSLGRFAELLENYVGA